MLTSRSKYIWPIDTRINMHPLPAAGPRRRHTSRWDSSQRIPWRDINLMWGILKVEDEVVCYKIQKLRLILKCLTNVFEQEEKRSHFWGRRFICCLIIKDYFTCESDNLAHIKQRANGQENPSQNSFPSVVLSAFTKKTILSSLLSSKTFNLESGILTLVLGRTRLGDEFVFPSLCYAKGGTKGWPGHSSYSIQLFDSPDWYQNVKLGIKRDDLTPKYPFTSVAVIFEFEEVCS